MGEKHFMQNGVTSNTTDITQAYLREKLGQRFTQKDQWPLKSPDCNPLSYFFGGNHFVYIFAKLTLKQLLLVIIWIVC